MHYTNFFQLCGFQPDEVERERPRIERAFKILEFGPADIQIAEDRVRECFDISLVGIREMLRLFLRELISLVLAKQENKKVVYKDFMLHSQLGFALMHASKDVYVTTPEVLLGVTMGQIFDKWNSLLKIGEERGLLPGKAQCGATQAYLGALTKGIIPVPDLVIVGGYFCDQFPLAGELISRLFNIPAAFVDGVVDSDWAIYPNYNERMISYTGGKIGKAIKKFEDITGCIVTEEMKKQGRRDNARYWHAFQPLVDIVATSDPQAISQANITLSYWLYGVPMRDRESAIGAITTLLGEVEQRVKGGMGIVEKGAPKVYYGFHSLVDPRIVKAVESLGLSITTCHANWIPPDEWGTRTRTIFEERLAEGNCQRSTLASTFGIVDYLRKNCEHFKVDGMIEIFPYNCRCWVTSPLMARQYIKEKLGIPVLVIEGDQFDSRSYSAQQLRTRVETFAEMLKANRTLKSEAV